MPIRYWHELSEDPEDRAEMTDEIYIDDSVPVFDRGHERTFSFSGRGELDFND